jgi:hypothetical protein
MVSDLDFVKFKRSLFKADVEKQLNDLIEQRVRSLPNLPELRVHPELILLCCRLVENSIDDNKTLKIDKKQLVVDALARIYNYSINDRKLAEDSIELLHSAGKINRVQFWKKAGHIVWAWIKRRWL